jgi:Ser/Thr protein kinase RdoA (MazF antagonist)
LKGEGDGQKVIVRVTPDSHNKHLERIQREIAYVSYLANEEKETVKYVCGPIKNKHGEFIVKEGDLIIVCTEHAKGNPVNFLETRWMIDRDLIFQWGKWMANQHAASRRFSKLHPEIASKVQRWDELHECIMKDAPIFEEDKAVINDPEHYGVVHGDLNTSNFFFIDEELLLSVFDWD